MVFSTSKTPCYIRVFKPVPILHFHFPLISVMKKHLSSKEALTLLLEMSDTDSDTESDVDALSIDAPEIVDPQAVEISGPFEIDNRNAVYQNLEPMQVDPPSDASDPEPMQVDPHPPALSLSLPPQSSPSVLPASTPSPPKKKIKRMQRHSGNARSPRKLSLPTKSSHIRVPDSSRALFKLSSSENSDCDKSSNIVSSGNEHFPTSSSDDDGSRFLPAEQFPGPPKIGDHPQKDLDDMNNSLDDFDLGEAITQMRTRLNFLISKVPFRIMCMYIKRYLTSILIDPNRPEWPVPGMDKNQKRHFRRIVERYTVKKGILYYLHKFSDKTIGYERGNPSSFFEYMYTRCNRNHYR